MPVDGEVHDESSEEYKTEPLVQGDVGRLRGSRKKNAITSINQLTWWVVLA